MDAEEEFPGLVCGCGSDAFQRVVLERDGKPPHRTVLAECLHCHAAFVAPPPTPSVGERNARLIQGVREAAKVYRKPSRVWREGDPRGRGEPSDD